MAITEKELATFRMEYSLGKVFLRVLDTCRKKMLECERLFKVEAAVERRGPEAFRLDKIEIAHLRYILQMLRAEAGRIKQLLGAEGSDIRTP